MASGMYSAKGMAGAGSLPPLDNRITEGGKPGVLVDHPSMAIYASDAPAIRNNIYQLTKRIELLEGLLKAAGIAI
jgi:hypothetical protein